MIWGNNIGTDVQNKYITLRLVDIKIDIRDNEEHMGIYNGISYSISKQYPNRNWNKIDWIEIANRQNKAEIL